MAEEHVGDLLKKLRGIRGMSQRRLALESGIDRGYISKLESKKEMGISLRTARALARGLDVPPEVFLKSDASGPVMPSPEAALTEIEMSLRAYIPVYAEVSLGAGIEPIDYVATTRAKPSPDYLKAYRARGLCFDPEIREGDTVIVNTELSWSDGDLVVCIIEGQASVKRYRNDGKGNIWLENNDGKYQPEECHFLGVVIELNRKIR